MANNTTGLQRNEVIEKQNYLGSIKVNVNNDTCKFTIKSLSNYTRVPIMVFAVSQYSPIGTIYGKLTEKSVDFVTNDIIKQKSYTINQDGTTTITITTNVQDLWSTWAIILPKEYII